MVNKELYEDDFGEWKIDFPRFIKQITDEGLRQNCGMLITPIVIFRMKMEELTRISEEIGDPRLQKWCFEMGLYEESNPESDYYDRAKYERVCKKVSELKNGRRNN